MRQREQSNNFLLTLFGFQKAKSTAHILLVVLVHTCGWCLFLLIPVLLYPVRINDDRFVSVQLIDKLVLIGIFYLHYYLLIPRLFERKRYVTYFSVVLGVFCVYLVQHVIVHSHYFRGRGGGIQFARIMPHRDSLRRRFVFHESGRNATPEGPRQFATEFHGLADAGDSVARPFPPPFPFKEEKFFGIPNGIWLMSLNNAVGSFALLLLMGGFIRLTYSFIQSQNEKKALENAKLNAEVNFLKSQINPHFLFNTLNSIYSQAHARSDNTEFSILKLSELLRYVLYDSGESKVELAKDIEYINNYIDLQKIRLSSKITIDYSVTGQLQGYKIAPMLLITFIENAFKHGISYTNASTIKIALTVFEKTLTLTVGNPIIEKNSFAAGGLGLKNVMRRLDLLYPGKYLLDVYNDDSLHVVNLKLNLSND